MVAAGLVMKTALQFSSESITTGSPKTQKLSSASFKGCTSAAAQSSVEQIGMQQIHHRAHLQGQACIELKRFSQIRENIQFIIQQGTI